jgi:hypothetical protein
MRYVPLPVRDHVPEPVTAMLLCRVLVDPCGEVIQCHTSPCPSVITFPSRSAR